MPEDMNTRTASGYCCGAILMLLVCWTCIATLAVIVFRVL